jgi:hypothetical protein
MANEFLLDSLRRVVPPEVWAEWERTAAAQGISLSEYIDRNTRTRDQGLIANASNASGGGGDVLPGISFNRFRQLVLAGAAGSVGVGIAGAGAAGAGGAGGSSGFGGTAGGVGAGGVGGVGGAGGTAGFFNSFGGQSLINAGLNLAGGYLNQRAQSKAESRNIDAMKDRIKLALQQLSPEHIQQLMRQFLPDIAAISNQQQQTALQGLNVSAARQGLANTPYSLTAQAGLRGQMANQVSTAAFQRAMETAGQRVSAITGAPFVTQQPQTGMSDAFSNTANQIMLARALNQRQPQQAAPYQLPGIPGQGTPAPWETQQHEGTPYQWSFNPSRY